MDRNKAVTLLLRHDNYVKTQRPEYNPKHFGIVLGERHCTFFLNNPRISLSPIRFLPRQFIAKSSEQFAWVRNPLQLFDLTVRLNLEPLNRVCHVVLPMPDTNSMIHWRVSLHSGMKRRHK